MNKTALIVEDDHQIAELIKINLEDLNIDSLTIHDGLEASRVLEQRKFDLLLLDLKLPGMNGLDLCRQVRKSESDMPIIMITAKAEEIDKVLGLETGADDYITKPFSLREFQARVKAVMRRSTHVPVVEDKKVEVLTFGSLSVDLEKRIAMKNGNRLDLTNKEFDLLSLLASNPGKSFKRQNLLNLIWGYEFEGLEHTINSHINRIRAKIEEDMANPIFIKTTWGYGYRFNENV